MVAKEEVKERPNLSVLAMTSFIASFTVARVFSSLYPETIWQVRGLHIHHFWYGIALLAIGGWLGISYKSEKIDRLAAILFGAGGGLIGDQVGLLLTLTAGGYWADVTYTGVIIFVTLASILILLNTYRKTIIAEFTEFLLSNASLYFGVFLAVVSVAFMFDTDSIVVFAASSLLTIAGCGIVLAYFIQRIRIRH